MRMLQIAAAFGRRAAVAAVGRVDWQPPGWLRAAGSAVRAHRRAAAGLLLAALVAAGLGYARAHRRRPVPPHYVRAVLAAPGVPPLGDHFVPADLCLWFAESVSPLAQASADASAAFRLTLSPSGWRFGAPPAPAPPRFPGPPLPPALARLDPPLPGTWRWAGDCRLVFTPAGEWPANQTLRVTLSPAALAPHVRLASYQFETRAPAFEAHFAEAEFYQNPKDLAVRQVTATVVLSHSVDPAALEARLSAAMLGRSPVFGNSAPGKLFSLAPARLGREFYLRTVPLALPPEPDTMKLRLAAGLAPRAGGAALAAEAASTVAVPDIYSFLQIKQTETLIVKAKDGVPEQFLVVHTSCAVRSEDLARALSVYALPADNPARRAEQADPRHAAENSDEGESDPDEGQSRGDRENARRDPPGDHDGRYHDDDNRSDDSGTEAAGRADLSAPPDDWSPDEVDAAALARARRLDAALVPSERDAATEHTFRLRDNAPGFLFVKVDRNVAAPGGYRLREDYAGVVPVPVPEKEISFGGDGGLLALTGERKLLVRSRGVPAIRYEVARVPAAEINHLASQTRGSFQNPEFRTGRFNEQDLARIASETQAVDLHNPVELNESAFDFTAHLQPAADGSLGREGLFFLTASGWDPRTKKYLREVAVSRFVLVTDLGLLAKRNADGSRDVFAVSLARGTPLGQVQVSILARSGATLAEAPTDDAGRAHLPGLGANPRDSREPVAIVARLGGDVAFLPYERADRALDFSRFATEGVESRTGRELGAFVFTERGVYRPGDAIHAGVIVKGRDWGGVPEGLPLETEVVDAREQAVQVRPLPLPADGFAEWSYQTAHDSPTGPCTLNVYLRRDGQRGTLLGSTQVQVKEFLPDRLKLDVAFSKASGPAGAVERGWVTPDDLHGTATLKNLYGTAAENHRVKAHLRLNPRGFAFKEYPGYTFYDGLRESKKDWTGETVELGDQQTAADGTARFDFDLARFADCTYRLTFDAEGFEAEGGRSVEDLTGTLVSPLASVVGWRADGDLRWIGAGGPGRTVEFIGVDRALNPVPLENLTVHLAEQRFVSVLTKDPNGSYRYESVRREYPLRDEPLAPPPADPSLDHSSLPSSASLLPALLAWPAFSAELAMGNPPPAAFIPHPSSFILSASAPGNFLLELRDAAGRAVCRLEYSVVGQGQVTRSLEKNAELEVKLARDQCRAGEDLELSITAPYAGSGLITIERERVYAHKWFTAAGTGSVQTIAVPPDFDGTGYVNVSFVRALDSKEIFASPLSYAAVPFTANLERRRLHLEIHAPEKTRPGEPLAIRYRADRPARVAVFAVDQGILQVTRFPLPDPLAYQFRKSALTVRTSQIVDLLLPEFSLLRAAQAPGGDGDPGVLNPFRRVTEKPVVYWSGLVDADTTERTLTYPVPDYFNGTLTIMAVAVSPDALGSAKTSTLCRNPFVLTPAVPTLAAPGDEFEVGLTVANGQPGSGPDAQLAVQCEPGPGLQVLRAPAGPLRVPEGHEASVAFRLRALDRLGSTPVGFRATAGGETSRVHATLSVRPAMPFRTVVTSGSFTGAGREVPVAGSGLHAEYRHLEASVSTLPLGLARGLARYLQEYPHGCSEQITSGAFARLALADEADFGLTRADAAAQIEHTIGILRRRQNDAGGFGFWDASKTPDLDFVTVYAMHFLSEAKAAGYPVPDDLFQRGVSALRRASLASPWSLRDARVQAYALYILTREGVVTTNQLLTLRDYLDTYYKAQWPHDLAAVYLAGCWSLLKKDDEANRLIAGYRLGQRDFHECWDFYQPLTADAQFVAMLARHFPERLRGVTRGEFASITRPVGEGEFSTLSAAYAVLALKAYSQAVAQHPPHLGVAAVFAASPEKPLALEGNPARFLRGGFPADATALRFRADGVPANGLGVFYQTVQSGFARTVPAHASAQGIEVRRDLLDADGKLPAARARLGDRLTVRLRLRALRAAEVTNVAVLDLLPGGCEVVPGTLSPGVGVAGMDYVDVREDRAVFYGTATGRVREITYQIKPTARGEFAVPPVFAESMYDPKIQSLGAGGHLSVTDAK